MANGMLVRFQSSVWTARKMDKDATREAKATAGAKEKAGVRVYKSVIAADALERIKKIKNAAYIEHCKRTVPWAYEGPGAITAEGYPSYKAAMAQYEKQFYAAVEAFYAVYAEERESARDYLGRMFDPADYPTTDSLRNKFAFRISVEPMPEAEHFRVVGLPDAEVAEIKKDIAANKDAAMQNANNVAWSRVVESVEMLRNRLREYSQGEVTRFYDSWLDNVSELIQLIPSVNVTNDPELRRIGQKLTALTAYDNESLKADNNLRANIIKQAELILVDIDAAYRKAA